MAKGGRPRKDDGNQGTGQVRVFQDVADMLGELALVYPRTTAQILDDLIRVEVTELHARYKKQIDEALAAKAEADAKLQKAQAEAARIASEQSTPKKKRGS